MKTENNIRLKAKLNGQTVITGVRTLESERQKTWLMSGLVKVRGGLVLTLCNDVSQGSALVPSAVFPHRPVWA